MKNGENFFRKESLDELQSPERLDDYIHTTRFSWWMILTGLVIAFISTFLWTLIGTIEIKANIYALVDDEYHLTCYLPTTITNEDLTNREVSIYVQNHTNKVLFGHVETMNSIPVSNAEAKERVDGDWADSLLITSPFSYVLTIKADKEMNNILKGSICQVSITTSEVKPISYIFHLKD